MSQSLFRSLPRIFSALAAVLTVAASGCSSSDRPLTIGVKSFGEQQVLGEILRLAVVEAQRGTESSGQPVSVEHCGDTFACHAKFRAGKVDVLVEYSGTAALYAGIDPRATDSRAQLEAVWKRDGGEIVAALGFDNGYRVAVAEQRAAALELTNISDVAEKMGPVRWAAPQTYLRRPGDGLGALLSRYGVQRAGAPLVVEAPLHRIEALLDGRADIAMLYETDGALAQAPIRLLADDDNFFPNYQALVLANASVLKRKPGVAKALKALGGTISVDNMRTMNAQVALKGQTPHAVASGFWTKQRGDKKPPTAASTSQDRPPVRIALRTNAASKEERLVARQAVRAAFAPRPVELTEVADVERALFKGRAEVALMEAASFFKKDRLGKVVRKKKVAAAAVVGTRILHAIVRPEDRGRAAPFGNIGSLKVGVLGSVAVDSLLSAAGQTSTSKSDDLGALIDSVKSGAVDCGLAMLPLGSPVLTNAMRDGAVSLGNIDGLVLSRPVPATPRARVPAGTYPNQGGSRAGYRTQVVLAATTPGALDAALLGGPAAALATSARPLTAEEIDILANKTGAYEAPDPALPNARQSTLIAGPTKAGPAQSNLVDTSLNMFTIAFLFFTAFLVFRKDDEEEEAQATP